MYHRIEQQSYKLALLYSSIQRLKTTHTFNLASHDLLSDLIFNQNTLDVKAVKLIQHNQSKQIMLRPATCFKATSIIQDWCYLHTFSHFVNTTTNANVQRRFNSVLATNTTAFSEETDMETNAKSEQHTKSPISSDRLVPLSSRIRASSTQLKLPTTPNTIPSFKRIPIDNKLRPNTSFIQQPAHPSSRTKQQLVDELRDILTCPSATVNTMWHAYTNVARWRGSLALLKKADFKAILGLLRGSDKHTAKLDHHEQDISDNYQSANLMHSQHQHRQGQVIVKRIMKVIRDMRLTKKRLPAHEYASLLTVCAYYQVPAAAEKLFKQCQEDLAPAPPPPGVYTAMMSTCLRLQRWDRVVDLFKQLIHVNWTPTNAQCNMTLRAYIEQDDYLNAQQLFKAMQHGTLPNTLLSSEPASSIPNSIDINGTSILTPTSSIALNSLNYQADIVTYNIWIAADIAAGHWSKAVERLEQMEQFGSPSPDKRTFYLLLKCYAQRNDQHGFMRIWHRLTQLDDGIDESVCKLALRLLEHRMSPVEAVNALFQQLPSINRHDVDSSDGQALARRMMMRALVRERASTSAYDQKRADFLRLYNESTTEMHDKASYDTTNIAMRGLLRYHASPKEMGQLIQWMDMNHVEMNASQWLWLLAYANRRNQPDDKQTSTRNHLSAYLRSFAWDQYALRRDTTGYNRLLSSVLVDSRLLAKDDRYSAGYSLLAAMKQDGHAITPKTLSLLATESTDIQMLNELWHLAFKSTNVSSMPAFISSFARLGQVDIARQLFGQLRANSKNHLPIQLYLQLMQAYRQSGSILNVRRMHRLLLVDGYWPNLIGMTILTDTRARFGRPISVRQVLRQLKTQQLQADLPLITVLLRSSLRHADLSAVGYLLNIMKQQKMNQMHVLCFIAGRLQ
ncbi:hypothetical protein BDF19DRAFT_412694 [Syncephalis fuscata]|nr:hypothetical protein BDF19DRAFT_412694 [Syncephalis fuscata]